MCLGKLGTISIPMPTVTLIDRRERKTTDRNLKLWSPIIQIIITVSEFRALHKTREVLPPHFLSQSKYLPRGITLPVPFLNSNPDQRSQGDSHHYVFYPITSPSTVIILFEPLQCSWPESSDLSSRGMMGNLRHNRISHTGPCSDLSPFLHAIALNMNIKP